MVFQWYIFGVSGLFTGQKYQQFLSTMQTLSFEDYNVANQCKGLDQSTFVCEYEVNPLTNDKVITEIQNFSCKMIIYSC